GRVETRRGRGGRRLAHDRAAAARAPGPRVAARAYRAPVALLAVRAGHVHDRSGGRVSRSRGPRSAGVRLLPVGPVPEAEFGAGHAAQLSRSRVRTLVLTSGHGGVGKSSIAANLAVALGAR